MVWFFWNLTNSVIGFGLLYLKLNLLEYAQYIISKWIKAIVFSGFNYLSVLQCDILLLFPLFSALICSFYFLV